MVVILSEKQVQFPVAVQVPPVDGLDAASGPKRKDLRRSRRLSPA